MADTIASALATSRLDSVDSHALLRHALKVDAAYLIAHAADVLTPEQRRELDEVLEFGRRARENMQRLIDERRTKLEARRDRQSGEASA